MCGWKDKRKREKGNVFRELVWVAMVALQEGRSRYVLVLVLKLPAQFQKFL